MFRTACGPARAQGLLYALLTCAALGLSACDTITPDWFGTDDEAASEPVAGGQDPAATVESEATGESGQVVEVISSQAAPTGEPGAPGNSPVPGNPQTESLAAVPPEPSFNDDPQQLIGMGPASLNAFLGAPELIRREAPASLWQYRAGDCVLDVVLYPDRSGDKVTYLEARENGATKIAPRTCLNKLLRERYGDSSG